MLGGIDRREAGIAGSGRRAMARTHRTVMAEVARGAMIVACAVGLGRVAAPPSVHAIELVAVTYNVGTNPALAHDADPADGYTQAQAQISDDWYGNGLAWLPAIDAVTSFFATLEPEVVAFQEIFHSPECAQIPASAHAGFVCETWQPGDPTVAQRVLGPRYQIACNLGKPDKCLAVHEDFGRFAGCSADLCLDGLDGTSIPGCGGGARVGRGAIELVEGGTLTVVNVHGTSGIADADQDCRVAQFAQIFESLDGEPAANGAINLVLADFNVDPARWIGFDPSANLLELHTPVGGTGSFAYVSEVGFEAVPTYLGYFNLDHQVSDTLTGNCSTPGVGGEPPVLGTTYFDHVPIVCAVPEPGAGPSWMVGVVAIGWLVRLRRARDEATRAARSGAQKRQSSPLWKPA
jgi:hypothetical protein